MYIFRFNYSLDRLFFFKNQVHYFNNAKFRFILDIFILLSISFLRTMNTQFISDEVIQELVYIV